MTFHDPILLSRGFTEEHRNRLAQITAVWCCSGLIVPNTVIVVINEHQVEEQLLLLLIHWRYFLHVANMTPRR